MNYELTDSEFLSAMEKALILKQWKRFIENGFRQEDFTKRIYDHLHLHCSFIAHFSREGFFGTYFERPEDTIRFVRQFDSDFGFKSVEYGALWWIQGDYADVNNAMCQIMSGFKAELYERLQAEARANDIARAEALLAKHDIKVRGLSDA